MQTIPPLSLFRLFSVNIPALVTTAVKTKWQVISERARQPGRLIINYRQMFIKQNRNWELGVTISAQKCFKLQSSIASVRRLLS